MHRYRVSIDLDTAGNVLAAHCETWERGERTSLFLVQAAPFELPLETLEQLLECMRERGHQTPLFG